MQDEQVKTSSNTAYQMSHNSVLRSEDALVSFGNNSSNLFIKQRLT